MRLLATCYMYDDVTRTLGCCARYFASSNEDCYPSRARSREPYRCARAFAATICTEIMQPECVSPYACRELYVLQGGSPLPEAPSERTFDSWYHEAIMPPDGWECGFCSPNKAYPTSLGFAVQETPWRGERELMATPPLASSLAHFLGTGALQRQKRSNTARLGHKTTEPSGAAEPGMCPPSMVCTVQCLLPRSCKTMYMVFDGVQ